MKWNYSSKYAQLQFTTAEQVNPKVLGESVCVCLWQLKPENEETIQDQWQYVFSSLLPHSWLVPAFPSLPRLHYISFHFSQR